MQNTIGSSVAATKISAVNLSGISKVAINNAWRVQNDFDLVMYPQDFLS
jgi:hypothetical protein